ncbi:hypothetical protein [Flammeovirga sp. SJP92]|uniref:hypothetical protein n=1 Tax=Flammeovirga sp. SJP92 TaxID=1775430 RepID=UPI0012F8E736|nr:hypothetical protein [Flammeovirga sp. SJP92]
MLIIDSIGNITYQNQDNSVYISEITDYDSNRYYSFKGEIVRHTKDTIEIELNTPIRIEVQNLGPFTIHQKKLSFVNLEKELQYNTDFNLISLSSNCHKNNYKGFTIEIVENGEVFFFGSLSRGSSMELYTSQLSDFQMSMLKSLLDIAVLNTPRSFYQKPYILGNGHNCYIHLKISTNNSNDEAIMSQDDIDYNVKELTDFMNKIIDNNTFEKYKDEHIFQTKRFYKNSFRLSDYFSNSKYN